MHVIHKVEINKRKRRKLKDRTEGRKQLVWHIHRECYIGSSSNHQEALPELHGFGYDGAAISHETLDVWLFEDEAMAEPPVSPSITENADADAVTDTDVSTVTGEGEEEMVEGGYQDASRILFGGQKRVELSGDAADSIVCYYLI